MICHSTTCFSWSFFLDSHFPCFVFGCFKMKNMQPNSLPQMKTKIPLVSPQFISIIDNPTWPVLCTGIWETGFYVPTNHLEKSAGRAKSHKECYVPECLLGKFLQLTIGGITIVYQMNSIALQGPYLSMSSAIEGVLFSLQSTSPSSFMRGFADLWFYLWILERIRLMSLLPLQLLEDFTQESILNM